MRAAQIRTSMFNLSRNYLTNTNIWYPNIVYRLGRVLLVHVSCCLFRLVIAAYRMRFITDQKPDTYSEVVTTGMNKKQHFYRFLCFPSNVGCIVSNISNSPYILYKIKIIDPTILFFILIYISEYMHRNVANIWSLLLFLHNNHYFYNR